MPTAVLLAATVTTGLMAGLFTGFAYAVMPGLARTDDRTFVEAMRRINEAIVNGWFLPAFLGAPVLSAVAVVLRPGGADVLPWLVAGLALNAVGMFGVTVAANVPLNNRLAAADDPAAARTWFERRWVRWNVVRAVAALGAFCCLALALVR
ncbi:Uncharacterized membrane protein [Amycolatopsis arida]|uniref:Uncharacterized membrane protein n=1 Tax=Amycolatopsis arida TaxID=587909 RepID=A0A1I5M000_9PSEU|nr:anthrone oxygenase family protein [Amycolatopsis arida]TDX93898.1 putative membrane protein [Amycolatopsis arida]SFP02331.1 Uncharacterized membrane protein [Amycolatopsis arida]